jgi:hypothetical protein
VSDYVRLRDATSSPSLADHTALAARLTRIERLLAAAVDRPESDVGGLTASERPMPPRSVIRAAIDALEWSEADEMSWHMAADVTAEVIAAWTMWQRCDHNRGRWLG